MVSEPQNSGHRPQLPSLFHLHLIRPPSFHHLPSREIKKKKPPSSFPPSLSPLPSPSRPRPPPLLPPPPRLLPTHPPFPSTASSAAARLVPAQAHSSQSEPPSAQPKLFIVPVWRWPGKEPAFHCRDCSFLFPGPSRPQPPPAQIRHPNLPRRVTVVLAIQAHHVADLFTVCHRHPACASFSRWPLHKRHLTLHPSPSSKAKWGSRKTGGESLFFLPSQRPPRTAAGFMLAICHDYVGMRGVTDARHPTGSGPTKPG